MRSWLPFEDGGRFRKIQEQGLRKRSAGLAPFMRPKGHAFSCLVRQFVEVMGPPSAKILQTQSAGFTDAPSDRFLPRKPPCDAPSRSFSRAAVPSWVDGSL